MIKKVVLENGLTIILENIDTVRSIALGIWVKNGSRHEKINERGMSHFIEHMLFKGTKNRTAKDIAKEMDAIGGQINAYTSREYTCYHTRMLDSHFDRALDVLADMYLNSVYAQTEIEKERKVIYEEIDMYEDSPDDLVLDEFLGGIWGEHSLSYPILGTKESLAKFDHNSFIDYYASHYQSQNTFISLAGNFDIDTMIDKISEKFKDFKSNEKLNLNLSKAEYKSNIIIRDKDIEQMHICLGFESFSVESEKRYALSIFNAIFGSGLSSRLFQTIREEKGLCYSIYSFMQSFEETGIFSIYAGLSREQINEFLKLVFIEIKNLKIDAIDKDTLNNAKEQLKSSQIISMESTATRMSALGRNMLRLNKIVTLEEIIENINKVSLDDMEEIRTLLFEKSDPSLVVVSKLEGLNIEEMFKNAKG